MGSAEDNNTRLYVISLVFDRERRRKNEASRVGRQSGLVFIGIKNFRGQRDPKRLNAAIVL